MAVAALAVAGAAWPQAANVVPLTVKTPHGGFNRLVVSLDVCAPGTDRCATIDDVMVDTGSTGLRLEAAALPPGLQLPAFVGSDGLARAECLRFVADDAWGPLVRVDFHVGGLVAHDLPVQVVEGGAWPRPAACPPSDVRPTSNGTLGIGPQLTDCPGGCEQGAASPLVFACEAGACRPVEGGVAPADRLPNPVARLPGHDDGVVFDLPAAPPGGAETVVGTLTFGLRSASGSGSGSGGEGPAHVVALDGRGRFTTVYDGASYPDSFIDSGTETDILADSRLPRCPGMTWAFCAAPERRLDATMVGRDGTRSAVAFDVGDYGAIRDRRAGASSGLAVAAAPASRAFVWGAPFFLGKRVSVVLDGRAVPGSPGLTGPAYLFATHPAP